MTKRLTEAEIEEKFGAARAAGTPLDGTNPDWMAAFTAARQAGNPRDYSRHYADDVVLGKTTDPPRNLR